ncbi:MAG: dihydroorotate dehydrogenase electron transfer subunit [Ignavibacteriales bacterium]|nr:dihydroorotate dehydrogenase electron transfer subunit [Ignavibacteriales bacterium]
MNEARTAIIQSSVEVVSRKEVAESIYRLAMRSPEIVRRSAPGQFVNIRCGEGCLPLLRRPFSISRVDGDLVELMFNVIGHGTKMLSLKQPGDVLDVLGPLGTPFGTSGDFAKAILVGGGLGVAPFPFLTDFLLKEKKEIVTLIGARTRSQVTEHHLRNIRVATDDGSMGLKGNVVDLLKAELRGVVGTNVKVFGCGPTAMLKALSAYASSMGIECELSLEGDMACGMGICQGCPVERTDGKKKYALVCTDGPTFKSKDVILR